MLSMTADNQTLCRQDNDAHSIQDCLTGVWHMLASAQAEHMCIWSFMLISGSVAFLASLTFPGLRHIDCPFLNCHSLYPPRPT